MSGLSRDRNGAWHHAKRVTDGECKQYPATCAMDRREHTGGRTIRQLLIALPLLPATRCQKAHHVPVRSDDISACTFEFRQHNLSLLYPAYPATGTVPGTCAIGRTSLSIAIPFFYLTFTCAHMSSLASAPSRLRNGAWHMCQAPGERLAVNADSIQPNVQ